jgi:hypothetical protein
MAMRMTIQDALGRRGLYDLIYVVWGQHAGKLQVVKVGLANRSSVGDRMRKHIQSSMTGILSRFGAVINANTPGYLDWNIDLYTIEECSTFLGEEFGTLEAAESAMCRHYNKPVGNARC